jgi:hypothetical protein
MGGIRIIRVNLPIALLEVIYLGLRPITVSLKRQYHPHRIVPVLPSLVLTLPSVETRVHFNISTTILIMVGLDTLKPD